MVLAFDVTFDISETYFAVVPEIGARLARACVQGDQPGVECRFENSAALVWRGTAIRRRRSRWNGPDCDAAIDEAVTIVSGEFGFGIITPALLTSVRIKGDNAVEGRGEEERAVEHDGGGFEFTSLASAIAVGDIAGVENPGCFDLLNLISLVTTRFGFGSQMIMSLILPRALQMNFGN